jgi:predicted DsbA family dithiol-disulfide isomerase
LRSRKYREAHQLALRHTCQEAAISAVPAFVIGQHRLEGLQSKETLDEAIDEATGRPAL